MAAAIFAPMPQNAASPARRVVITGAPGTGKTTLLKTIEARGYPVLPEMARELIREQMDAQSYLLPWEDHAGFGEKLFERQVAQYHQAQAGTTTFYDRGIPDNLGYLRRDGIPNARLEEAARQYPYFPYVYFTPPWPEIYGQDAERREDLPLMQAIHQALENIYQHYGYQLIEVPRLDPAQRADFILHHMAQQSA
jgi:predicted ATPase